jgi:hypothetical protein
MTNAGAVIKLEVPRTATQVLKVFRSSTLEERTAGRDWYHRARRLAEDLVLEFGARGVQPGVAWNWDEAVTRAAAVIAVLSPRLNWNKNVELARQVYTDAFTMRTIYAERPDDYRGERQRLTNMFPGLKGNGDKAYRILIDGEDPEDVVSGPKVTAFWRTIVDPSDPRAVVVDRHALDVAKGHVLDDRQRGIILGRKGAYEQLSALYRRAAKQLTKETGAEWTPAEVQAVTWTTWRRTHAANRAANIRDDKF